MLLNSTVQSQLPGKEEFWICEFWYFHNSVMKDSGLVVYNSVSVGKWPLLFPRKLSPLSSRVRIILQPLKIKQHIQSKCQELLTQHHILKERLLNFEGVPFLWFPLWLQTVNWRNFFLLPLKLNLLSFYTFGLCSSSRLLYVDKYICQYLWVLSVLGCFGTFWLGLLIIQGLNLSYWSHWLVH